MWLATASHMANVPSGTIYFDSAQVGRASRHSYSDPSLAQEGLAVMRNCGAIRAV